MLFVEFFFIVFLGSMYDGNERSLLKIPYQKWCIFTDPWSHTTNDFKKNVAFLRHIGQADCKNVTSA